jgi:signal peptidase II
LRLDSHNIRTPDLVAFTLRHRVGITTTVFVLVLDQAAKLIVTGMIAVGDSWPTDSFFRLTHAENFGSALELFSGHTIALIAASATGIGLLMALYWPRPKTGARPQIAFGLMLAGATGNLVDRVAFGHVIDFIDVLPWFIFNVADMAILIGLIGFAWDIPDVTARLLTEPQERS